MIDLDFAVLAAEMEPHAAAPTLLLKLRVTNAAPRVPVQNVMLQCQIRIEPTRRQYAPSEHEPLSELFGTPDRWGVSLHSMLWTYVNVLVPPFDTGCTFNLPVACSYDLNIAATKYFYGLEGGEVPLALLFSGTIFYRDSEGRLQIVQLSHDKEAAYRMPVQFWQSMMDHYYPDIAWLSLSRSVFDEFYRYKRQNGFARWEDALRSLLPRCSRGAAMNLGAAEAIARAVLYEGYILYPYRPSATKNRQRWTFGGIFPREFAARTGSDPCTMQTQCLVRGRAPVIDIKVRFLHAVERELGALAKPAAELPASSEPAFALVPSIEIDGKRFVAWQEAVEREILAPGFAADEWLNGNVRIPFAFSGMRQVEPLRRSDGLIIAVLLRTACAVAGELTIAAEPVGREVFRLTARIENITACEPSEIADRNRAQRRAFASTHTIFAVRNGAFVSLTDPPEALKEAATGCDNQGTWPVLVGAAGQTDLLLSSPIILYDHPQIAPESPGDFFDGTEIDEMLALRILTMTDEEKREMAATDLRTRELLERTEAMTPAELTRLHGALRSPRDAINGPWAAIDNKPQLASLRIGGAELTIGDRVRLNPRGRADIMDLVLKDRVAVIEAIECDFEDRIHLAVTVADDPGREFGLGHMPGHRFFFGPDEVQPLPPECSR